MREGETGKGKDRERFVIGIPIFLFSYFDTFVARAVERETSNQKSGGTKPEAFFSRLQNRGGQNLAGCGNFSAAYSFYCTACSL